MLIYLKSEVRNMEKNNIVLIGMPGVGKSTIGVILAKVLGYKFIDTDLIIQEKEQKLLSELIAENGVEGFIEIENKINSELKADKSVIATGGSVVYGTDAMENLKNIGKVIYLKQDFENIQFSPTVYKPKFNQFSSGTIYFISDHLKSHICGLFQLASWN